MSSDRHGRAIVAAVATVSGIEQGVLLSAKKHASLVRWRSIAAYLLRLSRFSYLDIATLLGRTDHTTAMQAHKRVAALVAEGDVDMITDVDEVQRLLGELDKLAPRAPSASSTSGPLSALERRCRVMEMRLDALQREVLDLRAEREIKQ